MNFFVFFNKNLKNYFKMSKKVPKVLKFLTIATKISPFTLNKSKISRPDAISNKNIFITFIFVPPAAVYVNLSRILVHARKNHEKFSLS